MLIVVAMSGGVDSSVTAALLREEGHEVVGVTMQIWPDEGLGQQERKGGCCALGAVRDARAVAAALDIPYYVFHMRQEFERDVIREFADAYARGRTPNPCIACNQHIKFGALIDKARRLGAQALATGHYARREQMPDGSWRLCRASDPRKDQSYVLYPLRAEDLSFVRFPVGHWPKERTRAKARELRLGVADKPDSQEICFVGTEGYAEVVVARHPDAARPGPIVDPDGRVLGQHRGLCHYTVGQRKGLGLQGPEARFVLSIDAAANALIVGTAADLGCGAVEVGDFHWLVPERPADGHPVTVKVRAGQGEHPARLNSLPNGGMRLVFDAPVRAATPGQAAVVYDGEVVLGGGPIDYVHSLAALAR